MNVHQDDFGLERSGESNRLGAVPCAPDDLEGIGVIQQRREQG